MAGNFLEQLLAEWYEYNGYFVRRNVLVGKRARGGFDCELDVIAFHPQKRHLVHLEPSMDASSWAERERRYEKKFKAGREYIPGLFTGLDLPRDIEQVAVLVFASKRNHRTLAGGRILLASELLEEIFANLSETHIAHNAIPEHLPILRSLQFVASYRDDVWRAMTAPREAGDAPGGARMQ